jgi:hypothetical protein
MHAYVEYLFYKLYVSETSKYNVNRALNTINNNFYKCDIQPRVLK